MENSFCNRCFAFCYCFIPENNLHETEAFENKKEVSERKKGTLKELLKHPKALITVVGLTLEEHMFYTYTTYMQKSGQIQFILPRKNLH
jgi:hypothetical protein